MLYKVRLESQEFVTIKENLKEMQKKNVLGDNWVATPISEEEVVKEDNIKTIVNDLLYENSN